jgi:hypothetical protein
MAKNSMSKNNTAKNNTAKNTTKIKSKYNKISKNHD